MTSLVVSITQPFSLIGVSLSETNLVCCMAEDPCSDVGMSVTVRYAAIFDVPTHYNFVTQWCRYIALRTLLL